MTGSPSPATPTVWRTTSRTTSTGPRQLPPRRDTVMFVIRTFAAGRRHLAPARHSQRFARPGIFRRLRGAATASSRAGRRDGTGLRSAFATGLGQPLGELQDAARRRLLHTRGLGNGLGDVGGGNANSQRLAHVKAQARLAVGADRRPDGDVLGRNRREPGYRSSTGIGVGRSGAAAVGGDFHRGSSCLVSTTCLDASCAGNRPRLFGRDRWRGRYGFFPRWRNSSALGQAHCPRRGEWSQPRSGSRRSACTRGANISSRCPHSRQGGSAISGLESPSIYFSPIRARCSGTRRAVSSRAPVISRHAGRRGV